MQNLPGATEGKKKICKAVPVASIEYLDRLSNGVYSK